MIRTHKPLADCVCPMCAEHRNSQHVRMMTNFINWTNGRLIDGVERVSERERTKPNGIDVPLAMWRKAGLRAAVPNNWQGKEVIRLGARAQA